MKQETEIAAHTPPFGKSSKEAGKNYESIYQPTRFKPI